MIVKDGEKFACDACVRGHRVSSCTHKDRKLNHVNKKGRPVSQCQHCRGLRKSRATHVKCGCGEHGSNSTTLDGAISSDSAAECHCQIDKRCTCALKRESPESDDVVTPLRRTTSTGKPIIQSHRSESFVPRLRTPHHPPLHRLNHAAHEHGQPYIVPKSRPTSSGQSEDTTVEDISPQTQYPNMKLPQQFRQTSPVSGNNSDAGHESEPLPSPRSRPTPPGLQLDNDSKTAYPALVIPNDPTFMYNAISPGNPHRYSLNDFSMFTLDNLNQNADLNTGNIFPMPSADYTAPASATDTLDRNGIVQWPDFNDPSVFTFDDAALSGLDMPNLDVPITPSETSIDHINELGPGLSRSSSGSGTVSDVEDFAAAGGFAFDPAAFPPAFQNAWTMGDVLPDLTQDAFDAEFAGFVDVNVPVSAPGLGPGNITSYEFAAQEQGLPDMADQSAMQNPTTDYYLALNDVNSTVNGSSYTSQSQSQFQPSYKDEEVRHWLTNDSGTAQSQGEVGGQAQDEGQAQHAMQEWDGAGEPTWF